MYNRLILLSKALMPDHRDFKSHHVTFIIRKGKILKIGVNRERKTHPRNMLHNYVDRDKRRISHFVGTHSELDAIMKYGKDDCTDCTFVNIRIDKNGMLNMAKPCIGCQSLLKQVGFKKVIYSTSNENGFEEWY